MASSRWNKWALVVGLLLCTGVPLMAQSYLQQDYLNEEAPNNELNEEGWQRATEGLDYTEFPPELEPTEPEEPRERNRDTSSDTTPPRMDGDWSLPDLSVLIYVVGIVLIALFLLRVFAPQLFVRTNTKVKTNPTVTLENLEENLELSELELFLQEALRTKNFRLAIRIHFLMIIKELSGNGSINWKKDKTNNDYLRELRKASFYSTMRDLTHLFERIWYGNADLKEADYPTVSDRFNQFLTQIKPPTSR